MRFYTIGALIIGLFISSCNTEHTQKISKGKDLLPSWNTGKTKTSILNFVKDVTNKESKNYVAIPDRIAVFDNDGNLWSEKPVYFQLLFAVERLKKLASQHPEWKTKQPFKSVLENDLKTFASFGYRGVLKVVMATHTGNTTKEFEKAVKKWLSTAKHSRFNRPYTDLVYQPMLELIKYLQANNFKTFIVSGGGVEFMRPWVEKVYNIPKENVIGSSIKTAFSLENGIPVIKRLPEIEFIDDKEGKPIGINRYIGRRPIFCSGNSDGDLAMMQWTAARRGASFMLYLHHTDSIREWAYDRTSSVGRLDKGLDQAVKNGWTIIDMKKDWKFIYPFELSK